MKDFVVVTKILHRLLTYLTQSSSFIQAWSASYICLMQAIQIKGEPSRPDILLLGAVLVVIFFFKF